LYSSPNRDELLDGIIEANENNNINWKVDGRNHILKLWDSGGHPIDEEMLEKFKDDMNKVIKEHHALFGIPPWDNYVTVIQLTEKSRGGLEHMNSQTSMLPRQCLMPNHVEEYRDLVSLFSHEYLHQWNVKRLRPRNFLDYDLQRETHTELLWWFEGCTSWLGDMICVRSGAWSEQDWRKDWMRKMKRTTTRNGMQFESLSESSHDAWIHLYRGHSFSRESQISYYNEGELAIFCLDAELQRRSKGQNGVCDLMVELCNRHAIEYDSADQLGVTYNDIRKALTSMNGGSRLGTMLDSLMKSRQLPDVEKAFKYYSLKLISDVKKDDEKDASIDAWLGIAFKDSGGQLVVTSHQTGSPLRELLMPGDEIIAINGRRTDSKNRLNSSLKGQKGKMANIIYNHEGVVKSVEIMMLGKVHHKVKLDGKGNQKWRDYISSRQG
jgi:predicted metalloprotease with PDZ domain